MRDRPYRDLMAGALLLAVCGMLTACVSTPVTEADVQREELTGEKIRTLIVGNTVMGPIGRRMYDFSYQPDGNVYGSIGINGGSGKWDVSDDGVYCHEWAELFGGNRHCYRWVTAEHGRYLMVNVDTYRTGDIPVWRIKPGLQ